MVRGCAPRRCRDTGANVKTVAQHASSSTSWYGTNHLIPKCESSFNVSAAFTLGYEMMPLTASMHAPLSWLLSHPVRWLKVRASAEL